MRRRVTDTPSYVSQYTTIDIVPVALLGLSALFATSGLVFWWRATAALMDLPERHPLRLVSRRPTLMAIVPWLQNPSMLP
jgi:hypothetical protein